MLLRAFAAEPSFVVAFSLRMSYLWVESSGEGPFWSPLGFPPGLTRHSLRLNAEGGLYVYVFLIVFEYVVLLWVGIYSNYCGVCLDEICEFYCVE